MSAEAAGRFNLHATKETLPKVIVKIEHGEQTDQSSGQAREASLGSLKGKVVLDDDWDSAPTNEAIARDFGMRD